MTYKLVLASSFRHIECGTVVRKPERAVITEKNIYIIFQAHLEHKYKPVNLKQWGNFQGKFNLNSKDKTKSKYKVEKN